MMEMFQHQHHEIYIGMIKRYIKRYTKKSKEQTKRLLHIRDIYIITIQTSR
jgi:hypothetical protein